MKGLRNNARRAAALVLLTTLPMDALRLRTGTIAGEDRAAPKKQGSKQKKIESVLDDHALQIDVAVRRELSQKLSDALRGYSRSGQIIHERFPRT